MNATSDHEDALEDLNVAKTEKSMADESKTEANKGPSLQDLEGIAIIIPLDQLIYILYCIS